MIFWILAAIAVHYVGVFLPAVFVLAGTGFSNYLGSRDVEPDPGPLHRRAQRVLRNAQESFVPFVGLAVLALVVPDADIGLATTGAAIFVLARAAYVPLYLLAVPLIRSGVWMASLVGLIMIAVAIV